MTVHTLNPDWWLGTLACAVSHDLIWRRRGLDDQGRQLEKTLGEFLDSGVFCDEARDLLPKVPKASRQR